jgi:hypothetical protein
MQLPLKMRQSAEDIILTNKVKYLELLKIDLDVSENLKKVTSEKITTYYMDTGVVYIPAVRPRLTDLIMSVASKEYSTASIQQKVDEYTIDVDNTNKKQSDKHKTSMETDIVDNMKKFGKWAAKQAKEYIEEEIEEELEKVF